MKGRIIFGALCVLVFSPQLGLAQVIPGGPVKPGGVRITTRVPQPDKWDVLNTGKKSERKFRCKPLACPASETVSITFLKSPTRKPDPKALEKFAKTGFPDRLRAEAAARAILTKRSEKVKIFSSKTATLKGYPSVVNESEFFIDKKAIYMHAAFIFAGPVTIRVISSSPDRQLAQKSFNDFIEVMKIVEGPPLPPGGSVPKSRPNGVQLL